MLGVMNIIMKHVTRLAHFSESLGTYLIYGSGFRFRQPGVATYPSAQFLLSIEPEVMPKPHKRCVYTEQDTIV